MSSKQGFFFDRIRSSADNRREVVVQGYAVDGYLDSFRPRAAIFVDGKPAKALKCRLEVVKLPPIQMRRRNGETISYLGLIFVDFSDISDDKLDKYGTSAKLVVVGEREEREMIYRASLGRVARQLGTYNFSVDLSYTEDGRTYVKGWMAGSPTTRIKVSADGREESLLHYSVDFIPRDDVLMEYPECPDDASLGFELQLEGEYKKLRLTMSEYGRSYTQNVTPGNSDDEFSRSNVISRYSEKVVRNLKNYGVRETMSKVRIRLSPSYVNLNKHYHKWIRKVSPDSAELSEQRTRQESFAYRPTFSILVPLYETDERFLAELIHSIRSQTYPDWEVCFSDGSADSSRLSEIIGRYSAKDARIRYTADAPGPLGISSNTNQAFSIARGDFIVLGDHDDLFTPNALYECVAAMNESLADTSEPSHSRDNEAIDTDIDVIYTDEDKTNSTAKKRFEPNIKPDYNQELLESCNYITHMFVVRRSLVDEVGLFDDTYNGAQDYDFILRCTERARRIYHVTKVVYSWRINDTSTAGNPAAKMYAYDAGVKALQAHYDRLEIEAKAEIGDHLGYYHTRYELRDNVKVYAAVLSADDDAAYEKTVSSIRDKSDFRNIEYIRCSGVDADGGRIGLARQMNQAAQELRELEAQDSSSIYICYIMAGVTMMGEDGISNMLSYIAGRSDVTAIGAKLYAVGGTLSHAGVILDMGSLEGWMYTRHSKYDEMYFNYSAYSALRSGVTLISLETLDEYGDFDETFLGEYAMIDYTYRMTRDGKKSIYDANANFQVRPGRGRDADDCFESIAQKRREFRIFMGKYPEVAREGDTYYSNSLRKQISNH